MASVIRYGSARLFASDSSSPGTLRSFSLVSDVSMGFAIPREEVRSIGSSDIIKRVVSPPSVSVSFNFYLSDLENSERFGIPVQSDDSLDDGQSILYDINPIDLALVTDESAGDIDLMSSSRQQELKVYVIKNAYLADYSIILNPGQLPIVSVTLEGEDINFKIFKNLSDYTSFAFEEDTESTNNLTLSFNETGVGGGKIVSTISSFSFAMRMNYKNLLDFGQFYHKRKVNFPIRANIKLSATVNDFDEGRLSNTFCQENLNKFIITYSRLGCTTGALGDKFGMVFKNALLVSQNYMISNKSVLMTDLSFDLDIHRNSGVFFVQQSEAGAGDEFATELGANLLLEGPEGGVLLQEAITNMMLTLENV